LAVGNNQAKNEKKKFVHDFPHIVRIVINSTQTPYLKCCFFSIPTSSLKDLDLVTVSKKLEALFPDPVRPERSELDEGSKGSCERN